jgi:DNA-binding CsgD family transcriptional regulator
MPRNKPTKPDPAGWQGLTQAQERMLLAVCVHGTATRAAAALKLDRGTAGDHMSQVFRKLGCDNSTHACLIYLASRIASGNPLTLSLVKQKDRDAC